MVLPVDGEPGYIYNLDNSSLADKRSKINSAKREAELILLRYYVGKTKAEQLDLRINDLVPHL